MRFPRPRRHQERTKTVIMTGGLNDIVTNLELKEGELHQVLNYMEIDGPYGGYVSVQGYERYDGKTAPSDTDISAIPDDGLDDNVIYLGEAASGFVDLSVNGHAVSNVGATIATIPTKFDGGSYECIRNNHFIVIPNEGAPFDTSFSSAFDALKTGTGGAVSQGDWTIDIQLRPQVRTQREYIAEQPGAWRLSIDPQGLLKFEISSTAAYVYDFAIEMIARDLSTTLFTHASIVSRDKVLRMAINGLVITDVNDNPIEVPYTQMYDSTAKLWIGSDYQVTSPYSGYLDEVRVSNVARWFYDFNPPTLRYSNPSYEEINYYDGEREAQRKAITEVPGSGPLRGVHVYQGKVFALRDNVLGDAGALYRADTVYMPDGVTIDDTQSGWTLIDATFNPGGRLHAVNWRFSGSFTDHQVMVMVDGKSLPRIWDGYVDVMYLFDGPESIGIPDRQDPPRYAHLVTVFDNRCLLAYTDKDLFLSSKFDPRDFTAGFGDQLLIGDSVTNMKELPGEAMGIFCRNSVKVLKKLEVPSGDGVYDYSFKVENFSRQAGALPWSAERVLDKIIYADDRGIVDFSTSDKYGDFSAASVSKKLNRVYLFKRLLITTSIVERQVNQYRLFFSDGSSLWFTFHEGKLKGGTYVEYPDAVLDTGEGEDIDGNIIKFFCSNDGYVYQMDKGTSFDGDVIDTELFTSFYHYGSPRNWKTFRQFNFEITAQRGTKFAVRPVFNYDSSLVPETEWWTPNTKGFSGIWGLDDWGEFTWGGAAVQEGTHYVRGVGRNMSIEMRTSSKFVEEHIIHNCIVDFEVNDQQQ